MIPDLKRWGRRVSNLDSTVEFDLAVIDSDPSSHRDHGMMKWPMGWEVREGDCEHDGNQTKDCNSQRSTGYHGGNGKSCRDGY